MTIYDLQNLASHDSNLTYFLLVNECWYLWAIQVKCNTILEGVFIGSTDDLGHTAERVNGFGCHTSLISILNRYQLCWDYQNVVYFHDHDNNQLIWNVGAVPYLISTYQSIILTLHCVLGKNQGDNYMSISWELNENWLSISWEFFQRIDLTWGNNYMSIRRDFDDNCMSITRDLGDNCMNIAAEAARKHVKIA